MKQKLKAEEAEEVVLKRIFFKVEECFLSIDKELEMRREVLNQFRIDNSLDEDWQRICTKAWIYCTPYIGELTQLDQWHCEEPALSETAKESAEHCIECWKKYMDIKDTYYSVFEDFDVDEPLENEILNDYLTRIAATIESKGKGERLHWRALKSFISYIRNLVPEERAFIEQIFPEKRDIFNEKIIRKVTQETYPISEHLVKDILMGLMDLFRKGSPRARLTAIESLALCWICLTASRLRLPVRLAALYKLKTSTIRIEGRSCELLVPSLFGDIAIKVSRGLAEILSLIASISSPHPRETVLQRPMRSLSRTLDRALDNLSLSSTSGNITYVTFLSSPHRLKKSDRFLPKRLVMNQ